MLDTEIKKKEIFFVLFKHLYFFFIFTKSKKINTFYNFWR